MYTFVLVALVFCNTIFYAAETHTEDKNFTIIYKPKNLLKIENNITESYTITLEEAQLKRKNNTVRNILFFKSYMQ